MDSSAPLKHKLLDDVKEVPGWVWLGGAAAVGLLYVLKRGASSPAPSSGSASASAPTGTPVTLPSISSSGSTLAQDYGVSSALTSLQQTDAQLVAALQASMGQSSGTSSTTQSGSGSITSTPISGGQPPATPVNTSPTSTPWFLGLLQFANGQLPVLYNNANPAIQYAYVNGSYQPFTQSLAQQYLAPGGGPLGNAIIGQNPTMPYTGPGTYNGVTLPAFNPPTGTA